MRRALGGRCNFADATAKSGDVCLAMRLDARLWSGRGILISTMSAAFGSPPSSKSHHSGGSELAWLIGGAMAGFVIVLVL